MDFLRLLHSWNRWLIVIVAIAAVVYFAYGLLQKRAWDKNASTLIRVFPILLDIQWALGLLFILQFAFASGSFDMGTIARHMWEHGFAMTVAVVIGHLTAIWRRKELPDSVRYRNNLLVVVGVIVVIFIGIVVLPAAVQWRFYTG